MKHFICGIHTSGKTSIISRLKEDGVIDYNGSEIGKDIYYQRKNAGFETSKQKSAFEQEITDLELARDVEILPLFKHSCVESWHPGNLAYALVRNPVEEERLVMLMKTSPFIDTMSGIWLHQNPENIAERTQTFATEVRTAISFYTKLNAVLHLSIYKLGLWNRTRIIDANRPLDEVYADVKRAIRNNAAI